MYAVVNQHLPYTVQVSLHVMQIQYIAVETNAVSICVKSSHLGSWNSPSYHRNNRL